MSTVSQFNPGVAELGRKNQANGYVGIDSSGEVVGTFSQRVGTAAEIAAIALAAGELAYASDTEELFIGDGTTVGGLFYYQRPQILQRDFAGGLPLFDPNADDPSEALTFPKVLGAVYKIALTADFYSDSGNQSNFSIRVWCNGFLDSQFSGLGAPAIMQAAWYDITTKALLEQKVHPITITGSYDDIGVGVALTEAGNLTKSRATLFLTTQIQPSVENPNYHNYIAFCPVYRTGGTSPATAVVNVTYQRIA